MANYESYLNFRTRREIAQAKRMKFGIKFLDDALCGIMPKDLILLSARTGAGKTQIATSIALSAGLHGKQVHFFALEAEHQEIEDRMVYAELAGQFFKNRLNEQFPDLIMRFADWRAKGIPEGLRALEQSAHASVMGRTSTVNFMYKNRDFTVDDFVKVMDGIQHESQLVIIDHLHFFDFRKNETEFEGLSRAAKAIRAAAMDYGVPVILLAQLRKGSGRTNMPAIEDLHGHSDIAKVATAVLLLSKAEKAPEESERRKGDPKQEEFPLTASPGKTLTYLHIAKGRHAGDTQDYAGVLSFDLGTGTYDQDYFLSKVPVAGQPKLIHARGDMPRWAKNAMEPIF